MYFTKPLMLQMFLRKFQPSNPHFNSTKVQQKKSETSANVAVPFIASCSIQALSLHFSQTIQQVLLAYADLVRKDFDKYTGKHTVVSYQYIFF